MKEEKMSEMTTELSASEQERYARQIMLPEIGEEGQLQLKKASVLVAGCGGLGSPAALYLAAAGVGNLGLLDSDRVELSNLQRQVLHTTQNCGVEKTTSAAQTLGALRPDLHLNLHQMRLDSANAKDVVSQYDVVVEAADNFATRKILLQAAKETGIPIVAAGIQGWKANVMTVFPGKTACWGCLFGDLGDGTKPPGVLGAAAGFAGILQAAESIKILLGKGETLKNSLLQVNLLSMSFQKFGIDKNPGCSWCGDSL